MFKKDTGASSPPQLLVTLAEELKPSSDVVQIPLQIEDKDVHLLYIKTVIDGDKLQSLVIKPFYEMTTQQHFESFLKSLPNVVNIETTKNLLIDLTRGHVLISIQEEFILLDMRKVNTDTVQQTNLENTLLGPQLGLSEDLDTNINLIRHRYNKSSLKVESIELKDKSHQSLVIIYDNEAVNTKVLDLIKNKLEDLHQPLIQSAGDLKIYLNDRKWNLFPTSLLTERPDRIIYNLAGGKVVLVVNGSPHALVAPVIFFDFMTSMEDNYQTKWTTTFTTLLRYLGLFICILLPGLYVAITSYNPEIFRIELALTVAGGRIGVPYSSLIEVLFMLIFMELLTEASIRLPKPVSATATTVGGLILGTAATEAALASNIMIIIVSAVAISTFVIPINEMSFPMRISRFLLLLFTSLFGIPGIIFGFLGLIMYMTNIESFGNPYLKIGWIDKDEEKKVSKG